MFNMTKKTLIVFSHGKESGPNGAKIQRLAKVGSDAGAQVLSVDYSGMDDPELRVKKLLSHELSAHDQLFLVGSSMGGYVSTVASEALSAKGHDVKGLFLLAPAFYLADVQVASAYAVYEPKPSAETIEIVHGWNDDVVPVGHSIKFAQKHKAALHVLDSDHRLNSVLPQLEVLFGEFLKRCMA
jgi:predicted alpha/beta hydrolase family esterase